MTEAFAGFGCLFVLVHFVVGLAGFALDSQLQAIVVGDSSDEFVRCVVNMLAGHALKVVRCEDVYSAVCKLGAGVKGVIFGRLGELCREDGRFFDIARGYGLACCCFVAKGIAGSQREVLAAMERGALVVGKVGEIDKAIVKYLEDGRLGASVNSRASSFLKDEFLTTKAELDALLGA